MNEGNIEETIQEARTIQNRFRYSTNSRHTLEDSARSFAKLMREGKVSAALYVVVKLDKKVLKELKLKQPASAEVNEDSLLYGPINKVPNCYFNDIDEIMQRAAPLIKRLWWPITCRVRSFSPYAIK